jgi:hypothetical protein
MEELEVEVVNMGPDNLSLRLTSCWLAIGDVSNVVNRWVFWG